MSLTARLWNAMYRRGPSWDLGEPDPVLLRTLEGRGIAPCRVVDLGCGTGDNAIELARRGFEVTAVDIASRALERAEAKAGGAGVDFRHGSFDSVQGPFDLVVDRGLLMSLAGERLRRSYAQAVEAMSTATANVFTFQWAVPHPPRRLSTGWFMTKTRTAVMAHDELEARFSAFDVEVIDRSVVPTGDATMRRLGLRRVAEVYAWLTKRAA